MSRGGTSAKRVLILAGGTLIAALLAACGGNDGIAVATPTPTETPLPATPVPMPTATPEPTPPPVVLPDRCRDGEEALGQALDRLANDIEAAMAGYAGDWGFGMVDLDCEVELEVRGDHVQYTASAGKIVPMIAALQALDPATFDPTIPDEPPPMNCGAYAGPLGEPGMPADFAAMKEPLLLVMTHSCDHEAHLINDLVTPQQIAQVLERSGVSERTRFEHRWNQAFMPAIDLARVWAALLDGRLLDDDLTEYLLALAARADIPAGLETFPGDAEIPGWQLGQKAGYCIVCDPYTLVGLGAGYLRPVASIEVDGSEDAQRGVAMVLMVRTTTLSAVEPQRRQVFPLLVDYVVGAR